MENRYTTHIVLNDFLLPHTYYIFYLFQFALVHYFTKVGAGEYYLEELEETVCMAEEKLKQKRQNGNEQTQANGNGNGGPPGNAQDSVSQS